MTTDEGGISGSATASRVSRFDFRRRANAMRVAAVAAGTGITFLRLPVHVAVDHIWAENGQTFMQQETDWGTLRSLFTGYQGYGHLVPRLTAALVSTLPMRLWAGALTIVACLVTSVCALAVYEAARSVIESIPVRVGLAAMVVLVPAARVESVGSVINVQYVLAFAAMWVAFGQPQTRRGCLAAGVFSLVAAGTTPFAGMALLIAGHRWWMARSRGGTADYPTICATGLLIGLVYQANGYLSSAHSRPAAGATLQGYVHTFTDVFQYGLLGSQIGSRLSAFAMVEATIVVVGLGVLAVSLMVRRERSALTVTPMAWFAGSTLAFAGVEYTFRYQGAWGPRYLILPTLCLMSALAIAIQRASRVGTALGIVLLVVVLQSFPASAFRDSGPSWSAELRNAAIVCDGGDASGTVTVPIGPSVPTVEWHMSLRCSELTNGR